MTDLVLVELDFNDKTWYLSQEGYFSDKYYSPLLEESPKIEIGQIKGGYIGVRIGDLSISNRPNERFSPFSIFGGGYAKLLANPTQKIPVRISWRKEVESLLLFSGLMYLKTFDIDKLEFLLEDDYSDVDLLTQSPDVTSELVEIDTVAIYGQNTTANVISPDHGLTNLDKVSVINSSNGQFDTPFTGSFPEKIDITVVDDNNFTYPITSGSTAYEASGVYSVRTLTKKNNPFSFGVVTREKGIVQVDDGTGTYSGYAYANPQLQINNSTYPLYLYDDGVLHGNTVSGNDFRKLDITAVSIDVDIVTITTQNNHGLVSGDVVAIFNVLPDALSSKRVAFVVIDAPTSTTFNYYVNGVSEQPTLDAAGAYLYAYGEYFGDGRYPTDEIIYSSAARNDLSIGQSGPYPDDPNFANPQTVDAQDGLTLIGTPLVSGISSNGQTLADLFSYMANKIGVPSVDFSKAPNASSINLELWETGQTKLVDYVGEVAYSCNHLFEIRSNVIIVIDREYVSESKKRIENYDIVDTKYTIPNPVKAIKSAWKVNIVNTTTQPASLTDRDESVMISNSAAGEIREVFNVTKNIENQRLLLFKIRDIINKPVIDMEIGGIRDDLSIGDVVQANVEEDGITLEMIIRTISYDFDGLSTSIVGDGSISVIQKDTIY